MTNLLNLMYFQELAYIEKGRETTVKIRSTRLAGNGLMRFDLVRERSTRMETHHYNAERNYYHFITALQYIFFSIRLCRML